jgi:hypothetical protein
MGPGRARDQMYGELTRSRDGRDARAHDDRHRSGSVLRQGLEPSRRRSPDDLHGRRLRLRDHRGSGCLRHAPRRARARAPGLRPGVRGVPGRRFGEARHFVAGARGVSEWRFTGTTAEGKKVEVDGCDLFTFAGDKIARKSSYFKTRTA